MNLRDFEYVISLAQTKSFSSAARACNVSQPALSNQIKKLEQELGAKLFDRATNDVRLTELGQRVVEPAEQILMYAQRVRDVAEEYRDPETQTLKIGMTPTLAPYLTKYVGDLLNKLYPNMPIRLVEEKPDELTKMVEESYLDFALISKKNHKAKLNFQSLWLEPVFLAVREGHYLARKESIRARDVPENLMIRLSISFGYDLEANLPKHRADLGNKIDFDLSAVRFETLCRHVSNSDDCTIVNAIAAEQFKRDNWGLAFIKFRDEGNMRDLGMVSRPEFSRDKQLREIGQYINETPPVGVVPTFVDGAKPICITEAMKIA